MTQLFTLPIPITSAMQSHPGTLTLSIPNPEHPTLYLLTFHSPPDNRLTTSFCQALLFALDILEFSYPPGVLVTTSSIGKFYSNGLDLEHASSTPGYWEKSLFAVWKRFLTYPMPTISLLNGHAFAGGLMTAMYHDYRIFNPSRGFLCLNELEFGAPLKPPMSSIFRQKLPSPHTYRSLVLEAKRFNGADALAGGLVDGLGGWPEVVAFVAERKLAEKGKTGVYGVLKAEMWRESLGYLEGFEKGEERDKVWAKSEDVRIEEGKKRVAEWEKNTKKSKL
ncbi:enoyl- hydratase isomerase protein [Rutstroemia sp. NJR-2017a WRK4]|nr:enoyl- hydratase isomerase protein [Rutstroemia sp. NJR-2017a WRK4]